MRYRKKKKIIANKRMDVNENKNEERKKSQEQPEEKQEKIRIESAVELRRIF